MVSPNLDPQEGGLAAKSHRPDAQLVALAQQPLLQLGQFRQRVGVTQRAEKLLFGVDITAAPVGAEGHTEDARRAALALRLIDRVQQHLAHPFQVAPGAELGIRQLVLRAHVLAPAPLEQQIDAQQVPLPLAKVKRGKPLAQIVAAVAPGE